METSTDNANGNDNDTVMNTQQENNDNNHSNHANTEVDISSNNNNNNDFSFPFFNTLAFSSSNSSTLSFSSIRQLVSQFIQQNQLTPNQAIFLAKQICEKKTNNNNANNNDNNSNNNSNDNTNQSSTQQSSSTNSVADKQQKQLLWRQWHFQWPNIDEHQKQKLIQKAKQQPTQGIVQPINNVNDQTSQSTNNSQSTVQSTNDTEMPPLERVSETTITTEKKNSNQQQIKPTTISSTTIPNSKLVSQPKQTIPTEKKTASNFSSQTNRIATNNTKSVVSDISTILQKVRSQLRKTELTKLKSHKTAIDKRKQSYKISTEQRKELAYAECQRYDGKKITFSYLQYNRAVTILSTHTMFDDDECVLFLFSFALLFA